MLQFRIVLEKTPISVWFALQKGKGTRFEIIQQQEGNSHDLVFDCDILIKSDHKSTVKPDFSGHCVQGALNERFIYIRIGAAAGQINSIWSRRLKVPLTGITWEMIQKAEEMGDSMFETRVPAIGKDGTPNCATVKPFGGWFLSPPK